MFDEDGLGDHGADIARPPESVKRNDSMDEKDDEVAHFDIVTKTANAMDCGAGWLKLAIRHPQPLARGR
jgi:hypothetical protein